MKWMKSLIISLSILTPFLSHAQCAMCTATAATSDYASSLNSGILYLLIFPIVVVGGAALYWYFNKRKFVASTWETDEIQN